jgi:transcription elongation GreA/GreB family factor
VADVERKERPRKTGPLSFVSPVAKPLMGKAVGDVVGADAQEIEIASIGSS